MKVWPFGGHQHKMHKKLKQKGRHGCHRGMKACEGPFEQRKCHFKKGKGCEKNKHHHGGKHHGFKRHGPKHLCLHYRGLRHLGLNLQNPCQEEAHQGDKDKHQGHGGPHHGHGGSHFGRCGPHGAHGGPHHDHGGPHFGRGGPHHGHGGPHFGRGGPNRGRGGPNNDCGCNRANFHEEHHGKHHKHAEKRGHHHCQCFNQQDQQGPSHCLERPRSV